MVRLVWKWRASEPASKPVARRRPGLAGGLLAVVLGGSLSTALVLRADIVPQPAASQLQLDVPLPLDHFKCYQAALPAGTEFRRRVTLADQFGTRRTVVLEPASICTAVDKNGEGVLDPTAHLTCYRTRDGDAQPGFSPQRVKVRNQFGNQRLPLIQAEGLCVPSGVNGVPIATGLDHFRCYTVGPDVAFTPRTVTLMDEVEERAFRVVRPLSVCSPVDKNGEGISHPESQQLSRCRHRFSAARSSCRSGR